MIGSILKNIALTMAILVMGFVLFAVVGASGASDKFDSIKKNLEASK